MSLSNTIIITWVRNGMTLGTKWYGTKRFGYEMTRNPRNNCVSVSKESCPLMFTFGLIPYLQGRVIYTDY